jgi:hypothetical protein
MADFTFNIAKGAVAEKIRDSAANLGVMVLKTVESDALMKDRATLTAILTGSTEANFTNYARKTGITGTITVDTTNDRVDVSCPNQTWVSAGGAVNNTTAKVIVYYDEGGSDGTRIPLTAHDFVFTTDGTDCVLQFAAAGFYRAA